MQIHDIKIIEITPYHFQFQVLVDCTLSQLKELFCISKKKWNQNTVHCNKSKTDTYPKNSIVTIDFFIPDTKDVFYHEIDVLYEDLYFLAVYKPPFLLVHTDGNTTDTLQTRVNAYLEHNGWPYSSQAIHRIDYEASGIVLFSKFPFFQGMFDQIIQSHACIKEYYAKVNGIPPFKKKSIHLPIGRNRHNAKAMMIHKAGKPSISHVEVIKKNNDTALCRVRIETGRKHQIRLHLSSIGFSIVNDPIYGTIQNKNGLLLENFHMEFIHPITQQNINIEIKLDKRF